jgi:hypothetical protein
VVAVDPFLSDRERVLVQTRAHTAVLAGAFGAAVLSVALLAVALVALDGSDAPRPLRGLPIVAAAVLVAVAVGRLVFRVWEWDRTVLAVTEEQVLIIRCSLRRQTHSVPLASVEGLRVRQSLTGRVLGYGSIVLENGGRRSRLAYVPQPARVSGLITAHAGRQD